MIIIDISDINKYRLNKMNLNKDGLPIILVDFRLVDSRLFYLTFNSSTKEYRLFCEYVLEANKPKELTS